MELKGKILGWISKNKYVILVLVIGLCFMLIPLKSEREPETVQTTEPVQTDITQELSRILSQIQGAGKVQVMLTVRVGQTTVYQTDRTESGGETGSLSQDTVIVTDSNRTQQGLVQRVDPPEYLGAIVVCSGADSAAVRLSILEAVSRITGLGADKISVLKMK